MTDTIIESMPFWLVWFIFGGLTLGIARVQGVIDAVIVVLFGPITFTGTYFAYREHVGQPPAWATIAMTIIVIWLLGTMAYLGDPP